MVMNPTFLADFTQATASTIDAGKKRGEEIGLRLCWTNKSPHALALHAEVLFRNLDHYFAH